MGSQAMASTNFQNQKKKETLLQQRRKKCLAKRPNFQIPLEYSRETTVKITLREGENYQIVSPASTDILEITFSLDVQRIQKTRLA